MISQRFIHLLSLFTVVLISFQSYTQIRVGSAGGCVAMYGEAGIVSNGAVYYSYIKNECNYPVMIESSYYKAKFRYYKESTDKDYNSTKKIKFPDVFLAPETSISKDKKRLDNSSKFYHKVVRQWGEMGKAWKGSSAKPHQDAIKLKINSKTFLGSKDGVNFYVELKRASGTIGFKRYKVSLIAHNSSGSKAKPDAYLNYDVYFHGYSYAGNLSVKRVRPYDSKIKAERERCIFNFVPEVYIRIKSTNISKENAGATEDVAGDETGVSSSTQNNNATSRSSQTSTAQTYAISDGAQFVLKPKKEGQHYQMANLVSVSGDTIYDGVLLVENEYNERFVFDPNAPSLLGKNFKEFKGKFFTFYQDNKAYKYDISKSEFEMFEDVEFFKISDKTYELSKKGKTDQYQLLDALSGQVVNSFNYKEMSVIENNPTAITDVMFVATNASNKCGIVNSFDQPQVKFIYSDISTVLSYSGYFKTYKRKNINWTVKYSQGLLDKTFKEVVPCKYDHINEYGDDGFFIVFNAISVGKEIEDRLFPVESFKINLLKDNKELFDWERLSYIYRSGSKYYVSKSKLTPENSINCLILKGSEEGKVMAVELPKPEDAKFEGGLPAVEFEDVNKMIFFAQ